MSGGREAAEKVRFFSVSLVNATPTSLPKFPQPQRLTGELVHSMEAANPRFAWVQFLFRRVNFLPTLVAMKNSIHLAAEQIKTPKKSWIDDSEYDRAELHRDWYKRSGEKAKRVDAVAHSPHVLLAVQGMWVGDPALLYSLPFKDCHDEQDRLGLFVYRNPWLLAELVNRRMVEDVAPYFMSYAGSRLEPPSFLLTREELPNYIHLPIVREAGAMKSVSFKQFSQETREGIVEGAHVEEPARRYKILKLGALPLIAETLKDKDSERLALLPSTVVRTFEILYDGGKTHFLVSSRSESDAREYLGTLESVYGELDGRETGSKPEFLVELPRLVGLV